MNDTHSQNSQAPNSALSKQIGQVRCKAVLTIQRISPWGDQRAGKRSAARHGQHARPPFPPSEERGTAQQWGCGPSPHSCKVTREVGSLSAPSASGFDANDHQSAAVSALRTVTSTANCAPWNRGSPLARTSMALSSAAGTATFMSRSLVLHRTNAPASRQMRARVLSGPTARVRILRTLPNVSPLCPVGTRTRKQHR